MEQSKVKIYIAGASSEIVRAESAIAWASAQGLEVTSNWAAAVRRVRGRGGIDFGERYGDKARHYADLDIKGVKDAYLFWLLVPSEGHPTACAWIEFGVALERCGATIASGGKDPSLFTSLATARVATDKEAREKIMDWAKYLDGAPTSGWSTNLPKASSLRR